MVFDCKCRSKPTVYYADGTLTLGISQSANIAHTYGIQNMCLCVSVCATLECQSYSTPGKCALDVLYV